VRLRQCWLRQRSLLLGCCDVPSASGLAITVTAAGGCRPPSAIAVAHVAATTPAAATIAIAVAAAATLGSLRGLVQRPPISLDNQVRMDHVRVFRLPAVPHPAEWADTRLEHLERGERH